jgi:uncharacterized membrane protein YcaP (DUF421 family)
MNIDWHQLILGKHDWAFLLPVAIRTFVMFLIILVGLRVLGKRGVGQLSVFELGVIVGLGSAAGDPMFYEDVGLLSCVVVFVIVLTLYHLLELITTKNARIAVAVEGKPREVLRDGVLVLETFDKEPFSEEELFMQLRLGHVSHLGQVRHCFLEPSGQVSVYYYADADVIAGLPIIPETPLTTRIEVSGEYACARCGRVEQLVAGEEKRCSKCRHPTWARAVTERRVT